MEQMMENFDNLDPSL